MSRYFVMSSRTPEGDARAGTPTGVESSPPLDERAEVRDLLPDSPAGAFIATSADIPLQGDAHEHVERTPPQSEGGGVPPSQQQPILSGLSRASSAGSHAHFQMHTKILIRFFARLIQSWDFGGRVLKFS
jgi:hypothetical protein